MLYFRLIRKLRLLLGGKYWRRVPLLVLLMIIAGVFETISVSIILPFMDIVIRPEYGMNKWYIRDICHIFRINSPTILIALISIFLALLYLIKNAYLVWEIRVQQKFVSYSMKDVRQKLLTILINRPYEYYIEANTGNILTIMNGHMEHISDMLGRFFNMMGEAVTVCMLILALVIVIPQASILMGTLLGIVLFFVLKVIRPVLGKESQNNQAATDGMYKWILQSIQGIKEVKVMKSEQFFLEQYSRSGEVHARAMYRYMVWSSIPRSLIETFIMSSFFLAIAVYIIFGHELTNIIPAITMIAMATVRLLPAANRISTSMGSVIFSEGYIDDILGFYEENTENSACYENKNFKGHIEKFNNSIDISHVSYHYPKSDEMVLKDISLTISKGESVGIVGVSGAGKSTLMDIILGLLEPIEGEIYVDNTNIKCNYEEWVSMIGYIPQSIFLMDDSIRLNVAFGTSIDKIDDDEVWKSLDNASLGDFVRKLPKGLDTEIGERGVRLSGGQRQRIGIARALYRNPQILCMDEATSALDNETEEAIIDSISRLKGQKTLIIIAHRLTTIEECDHIYRVETGKIVPVR